MVDLQSKHGAQQSNRGETPDQRLLHIGKEEQVGDQQHRRCENGKTDEDLRCGGEHF